MGRLESPRRGRRIRRVLTAKIEFKWRIDDPRSHQLGPDQVHRCTRELWMAGDHPRKGRALLLSRIRVSAVENECRGNVFLWIPARTAGADRRQIVALPRILHDELREAPELRRDIGLAEETRLPPDIRPLPLGKPEV